MIHSSRHPLGHGVPGSQNSARRAHMLLSESDDMLPAVRVATSAPQRLVEGVFLSRHAVIETLYS